MIWLIWTPLWLNAQNTYYTYQSGSWDAPGTWTTDPSGSLHENSAIPAASDHVVILNGRTVSIISDSKEASSIEIKEGGTIDLKETKWHSFGVVTGEGMLRLRSNSLPAGNLSGFTSSVGGTVEYYNVAADFNFTQLTYNNLILNFDNPDRVVRAAGDMTINGNLIIQSGRFQINNTTGGAARTINISGSVYVHENGRIQLGTDVFSHTFNIQGDFTIDGEVRFTDRIAPDYLTAGGARANVVFNNTTADQHLFINAIALFYRIGVNKGIDETYILHVEATDEEFFKLYGPNNLQTNSPGTPPNITNNNALGLEAGTLRLGQNIIIPALASSNNYRRWGDSPSDDIFDGRNYAIDEDATLWIDGASVFTTHFDPPSANAKSIMSVYGKLKITAGELIDNAWQGIGLRTTGQMIVEGGTVNSTIIRTSAESVNHRGAYIQTGGTVTIRRDFETFDGFSASFHLGYSTTSFFMSGGELNILRSTPTNTTSTQGREFSFVLSTAPENIDVTGGTINIHIPDDRNAYFTSRGPFYNLNIIKDAPSAFIAQIRAHPGRVGINEPVPALPLQVINNLELRDAAVLSTGSSDVDVSAGANFIIESGATYSPGTNTTIFNGSGPQVFDFSGTITSGLNRLSLKNSSDLSLEGTETINVRSNVEIESGTTLRDNGRAINVEGNINNSGTHFKPAAGAGRITLTGGSVQTISGDGNGRFNNLAVNKSGGSVTVLSDITVTGILRLVSNHPLFTGSNKLSLGPDGAVYSALTGTDQIFSATKMIVTNGLSSDGGVQKTVSNTNEFLFPFGFRAADNNYYYMPANIGFSQSPETWGDVTISPVSIRHPLAQGTLNAITTYWKTLSTGFTGIAEGSVTLRYFYDYAANDYFVAGNETEYRPAVYTNGTSWETIPDINLVDQVINQITFSNRSIAQGDFTAGETGAFTDIPILYSRQNGDWDETSTWSETGVGGDEGSHTPGPGTIIVIGDESNSHIVNITNPNRTCGALFITSNSTLDIGSTQGHNFSAIPGENITGSGRLRISSNNYFPQGDFGEFISPLGGTVEYYTGGTDINLPVVSDGTGLALNQYRNLVLNHMGHNVVLPDIDLTIHEDLSLEGTTANSATNTGNSWGTLTVKGNIYANSGTFLIMEGDEKTIVVQGDLIVESGATFSVRSSVANCDHKLELYGNLNNEGEFNLHRTDSRLRAFFRGTANTTITGNGGVYNFYNITIDKGESPLPVVSLQASITTGVTNPFLILQNGTFRVDSDLLTVTLTDGNTNFEIPPTAALSVNAGEVRVCYGSGDADLLLAGRLEMLGGNLMIGDTSLTRSNSIEYAGAGKPEILANGGTLIINSQVRRPLTISGGSLNYLQNGGEVIILGKNREASRALFEITNPGSLLNMNGGILSFSNPSIAGGATIGDVYLRPEASDISGGTMQFGLPSSAPGFNFRLSTSSPLWNVNLGAEGSAQFLTMEILPATILNNLTITGNSQFRANGIDLYLGGNFTNNHSSDLAGISNGGFIPGSISQTLRFNGSNKQLVTGLGSNLTNFANLMVNSPDTVALQNNTAIRVNADLTLTSGVLDDGSNTILVTGNIINIARHSSSTGNGGIELGGTEVQIISGIGGTFGNIILNNPSGALLKDNVTLNGKLTFSNGSIYIDDYLLTFGINSEIGGAPGSGSMIILNGVLSDQGVRRLFPAGATDFTMPIGVPGKYTPASFNITQNALPGSITVRPVDRLHPAVVDPALNELAYYWSVDSTGFGIPFSVDQTYYYLAEDVKPNSTSDANYVVGHYLNDNYEWSDLGDAGLPGSVNESMRTFTIMGANFVTGDFTAGEADNFTPPFDIFYSRNGRPSNDWTNPLAWSIDSHSGPAATYAPFGNPVVIAEGHTIDVDADEQYSVSVEVNGTLNIGTTVFHDLGTVSGTGKIEISSTSEGFYVFPGGNFNGFLETTGTILEFIGDNAASLPPKPGNFYKPFQNVIFSGTGQKNMSADNMKVLSDLTIRNGTTLNAALFNKNIYILGDWINENTAPLRFNAGTGTVFIEGLNPQQLIATSTERFYNLVMDNADGMDIAGNAGVEILRTLTLSKGNIFSYPGKEVTLLNTSPSQAVIGGGENSFVDGPLRKRILNAQSFDFPVGNQGRLGRILLLNTSVSPSPGLWTVNYVNRNPDLDGYLAGETNMVAPLTSISNNEYWEVDRPAAGAANIRLRWDENSFPDVTSDPNLRSLLRVVEYEQAPQEWTQRGQIVSGLTSAGSVSTSIPVEDPDYIFTLGVIGVSAAIADLSSLSICDNEEIATIPVNLTGSPPWSLTYRTSGSVITDFTETNINSSPFNIQLRGSDVGGPGPYEVSLVSVSDAGNSGVVNLNTVDLTVKLTNKPVITGPNSVGSGETRTYSTNDNSGNTYLWSWDGTAGGDISTPVIHQTGITFNQGVGLFLLNISEITTSTGCSASGNMTIEVLDIPVPDIEPKTGNICQETTETYSTTYNAGNQYYWSVTGGDCTGCEIWIDDSAKIIVEWTGTGDASISVEERIIASPEISGTAVQNYFIYLKPHAFTVSAADICAGNPTSVVVENSQEGVNYQLRLNADNSHIGSPVAGTGGPVNLFTGTLLSDTVFNVLAYNLGCELESAPIPVTVLPLPDSLLVVNDAMICDGETATIAVSGTESGVNYQLRLESDDSEVGVPVAGNGGDITFQVTPDVTTDYNILATNGTTDCSVVLTNKPTVTVNPLPDKPEITPSGPTAFCQDGSVVLSAPEASSWLWSTGETTQDITVSSTETITVRITDANGCESPPSDESIVTVNPLPDSTLAVNDAKICDGETATITVSGTESGVNYQLRLESDDSEVGVPVAGNGGDITFQVTPDVTTDYNILATNGTTDCSVVLTNKPTVTVNPLPDKPEITPSGPTAFCQDGSVVLSAPEASSWLWSTGETTKDITVSSTELITVKVTDTNGCSSENSDAVTITVNLLPDNSLVVDDPAVCAGEPATITVSGTESGVNYQLRLESDDSEVGGAVAGNGSDITFEVTPGSATTYNVLATDGTTGCSAELADKSTVTVNPLPDQPKISADGSLFVITGNSVQLSGPSSAGYFWTPGGETTQSINVSTSGSYSLFVENEFGCISPESDPVVVVVSDFLPPPVITVAGSLDFCDGGSVMLSGPDGFEQYNWSDGSTGQIISVTEEVEITLVVTNSDGVQSFPSDLLTVVVYEIPEIQILDKIEPFCAGLNDGSISVGALGGEEPYQYSWQGYLESSPTLSGIPAGNYTSTVIDDNGCSETVYIELDEPDPIEVEEIIEQAYCPDFSDGSIELIISGGTAPYSINWSAGGGNMESLYDLDPGSYSYEVTDGNNCSFEGDVVVGYENDVCFIVPEIITPNDDGYNDTWRIDGIEVYPDVIIEIFDRWGKRVFYSEGYNKEFDGTFNGKELPMESYHYMIDLHNGTERIIGNLTIIR